MPLHRSARSARAIVAVLIVSVFALGSATEASMAVETAATPSVYRASVVPSWEAQHQCLDPNAPICIDASEATAINNAGVVVGASTYTDDSSMLAMKYANDTVTILGSLPTRPARSPGPAPPDGPCATAPGGRPRSPSGAN